VRIITGLGNPGREYEGSRHNIGFMVVRELAQRSGIRLSAGRGDFMSGEGTVGGARARLVMPLTYMNRSGRAVCDVLKRAEASADDLLVICDDVNLPFGQLRLRRAGSDGGHNGLASIVSSIETEAFARLRVGVGTPHDGEDRADFVLDAFTERESAELHEVVARAADAVETALGRGLDAAMNDYNRRMDTPEED
jgi:PTH1 family peptidyl-tRNA hydrolase